MKKTTNIIFLIFPIFLFGINIEEVYFKTLDNDEYLKTKYFDLQAKNKDLDLSKSRLYPSIDATVGKTKRKFTNNSTSKAVEREDYYSYNIKLSQTVYDHSIYSSIEEENINNRLRELIFEEEKQKRALEAINIFVDSLKLQNLIELTKQELKFYEIKKFQFEKMYKLNLVTKNNLDKSKLDYNEKLILLNENKNDLKLMKLKLFHFTNEKIDVLKDIEDFEKYNLDKEFSKILIDTKQYRIAKLGTKLFNQKIETVKSKHYPTLNLRANYTKYDSDDFVNDYLDDRRIVIEFNLPIYQGGNTSTKVEKSKLEYQSSKSELTNIVKELKNEYEEVLLLKEIEKEKLIVLENAIKDTKSYYNSIVKSFDKNLKSLIDLEEAKYELYKMKYKISEAKYEILRSNLKLKFLIGKAIFTLN